jgi:uncharacterized protein
VELVNEFEVGTDLEEAWRVLTDVERIAPCLPGAELREVDGEEFRGVVKVKVGPITAEYKGKASFRELDAVAHRAVLAAEGRESRGQGSASAIITAQLEPSGKGTKVSVVTDLSITGKVAQFGRGVLADVSSKLLAQFADNLESMVLSAGTASTSASNSAPTSAPASPDGAAHKARSSRDNEDDGAAAAQVRKLEPPSAEPVDLVDLAGGSVARRIVPLLAIAAVALIALLFRRRLR